VLPRVDGQFHFMVETALPGHSAPLTPRPHAWQFVVLAALSLWLYYPTILHLAAQWSHDPNFSHGFLVPLFSAFVVWQERRKLSSLPLQPSWSGFAVLAIAMALLVTGQLGAELFLARLSLVVLIAGLIALFLGWNYLRALLFPWAFLLLMIPIPTILLNQIALPLQLLASRVASSVLPLFGVPVLREGNILNLSVMTLEVAEACSGIRSLMSLVTLAIIYGYFAERRVSLRVLLALAAVPIAVVANSFRIIGTGLLVQFWNPDKAEGFFHTFQGWLIFVVSMLLLLATHRVLLRLAPRVEARL
jgi:exosortase